MLEANLDHWNRERGPWVEKAVFRNDLSPAEALDLCLASDGEVDIVTEVSPADAERVLASEHARLVVNDANRVLVGIVNRQERDVPLSDPDVRRALNLAVDRARVVDQGLDGYGTALPALTPPWCSGLPGRRAAVRARPGAGAAAVPGLAAGPAPAARRPRRPSRASPRSWPRTSGSALGIDVDVAWSPTPTRPPAGGRWSRTGCRRPGTCCCSAGSTCRRRPRPPPCTASSSAGRRVPVGPPVPEFDALFDEMKVQLDGARLVEVAERIDALCHDQALSLFLCAPQALYAVNKRSSFGPYRTTFELAEVTVDDGHWSLTRRRADLSAPLDGARGRVGGQPVAGYGGLPPDAEDRPGFSGAAGNAC